MPCGPFASRYDRRQFIDPTGEACARQCAAVCDRSKVCAAYCRDDWQMEELDRDCPDQTEPWFDASVPSWVCRQRRRAPMTTSYDSQDRDTPLTTPVCPAGEMPICTTFVCERRSRRHNMKPPARCNMTCGPLPKEAPSCPRDGAWMCNRCTGVYGCFTNLPSDRSMVRRGAGSMRQSCAAGHLPICAAPPVCVRLNRNAIPELADAQDKPRDATCTYRCASKPPADLCLGQLVPRCDACTGVYGCVENTV